MENFVNGFTSWTETHFEIVDFITTERNKDCPEGKINEIIELQGTGGMYELSVDWTNEFEKLVRNETWEENDFYDEVYDFCKAKNKL